MFQTGYQEDRNKQFSLSSLKDSSPGVLHMYSNIHIGKFPLVFSPSCKVSALCSHWNSHWNYQPARPCLTDLHSLGSAIQFSIHLTTHLAHHQLHHKDLFADSVKSITEVKADDIQCSIYLPNQSFNHRRLSIWPSMISPSGVSMLLLMI